MSMIAKRKMIILAASFISMAAWAVNGTWTGTVDGRWNDSSKWQGGVIASGAGAYATLADFAGPVRITNDVTDLKLQALTMLGGNYTLCGLPLTIEGAGAAPYGLYAEKGAFTIEAPVKVNRATRVIVKAGASLTTKGTLDFLTSQWVVKYNPGEWCFEGSCAETNASSFGVTEGTFRLKEGAVFTFRGGHRQNFLVGYNNTSGRLVVDKGATLNIGGFTVGYAADSKGSILIDGGTLTANTVSETEPSVIGHSSDSVMSVSNNAAVDIGNWLNVGVLTRGELTLGSGATLSAGRFSLGWKLDENVTYAGSSSVSVGGGTLTVNTQFVWRASGPASRTNAVTVGNGQAGSGVLNLPATVRSAANPSFAKLTLDGGSLGFLGVRDAGYNASLTNYLYGLDRFLIGRAGAVIDCSNLNATVTQTLQPDPSARMDGGLTKRGTGRLTLAGGATFAGPLVVAQGTLRLQGALPSGSVTVAPGAGASLVDGQFRALAPDAMTAGQGAESAIELEAGAGNASDSLTLPAGARLGKVVFTLAGLNGGSSYWLAGDYAVAAYAGADPDVSGWRAATPAGVSAAFEVQPAQKRVVLRVTGAATGSSVWLTPGSGAWPDAANWNTAPANDPGTAVLFGTTPGAAASVGLGSAVTVGRMTFDAPFAYTLSGSEITFGTAGAGGTLAVRQGAHEIGSALALPADLALTVQPGASVLLSGGVSGAGRVTASGGGTLAVADGAGFDVPLTLDGAVFAMPESTTVDAALTVGTGGTTLLPAYGKTLTLSGAVEGAGALTKDGASIAVMTGANTQTGARTVRNGTLEIDSLTEGGDLVIGEGTLRYTGPAVTTDKGLTIRTSTLEQGATFETDADVTLNGNVWAESGSFIKAGKGTMTLAGTGENLFGNGFGPSPWYVCLNRGVYGEGPTRGFVQAYIADGKLVMGGEGQTNRFTSTLIVGGETTVDPEAETAAHLEINGGRTLAAWVTVGRGNGTATTAPTGLVSSVRLNGGHMTATGLWLGIKNDDAATLTSRPLFEMNDGVLVAGELYGGSDGGGGAQPRLVFNGGTAVFTGAGADFCRLARGAGTRSELVVAGGTVAVSNTLIRLAENAANAKGVVRLNGGRLITRGFAQYGSGAGELCFNGGVLQPCLDMVLSGLTAAKVQAGGLVADVPAGLSLTVAQALAHDAELGGPDGGVVKLGGGTLVLGGALGYTGPTVVSGGVLRVSGTLAVTNVTVAGGAVLSLMDGANTVFAPSAFAAGEAGGNAVVELEVAPDGSASDVLALPVGFGGALTLGAAESNAVVRITQGSHTVDAALAVPSAASVMVDAGASLSVQGAVTGAGSLTATGGGTLILTNGPACDVPVTLDGVTLGTTLSTVFDAPLALGAGGALFVPATGNTVTVASDISGAGGLTKGGSSILTLGGANTYAGETFVRNGTLSLGAEPAGPVAIGEGTLKYTGPDAAFTRGYTLRTAAYTRAATIDTEADITFQGPVAAELGAFIKLGSGTLTYGYAGDNILNKGQCDFAPSLSALNVQPYGDSPTTGYRGFNIFNGKVVMGVPNQTNWVEGVILVGGYTTEVPGAETAGHLEVNGGYLGLKATGYIAIGRGNGTSNSAPEGIESTMTINGGDVVCAGFVMGQGLAGMASMTARPRFVMNGGSLATETLYCGETLGTAKPRIEINGGTLKVGPAQCVLASVQGCETEMTLSGGTVLVTGTSLSLAYNHAGAKGTLTLNGGCLTARTIYQGGTNCTGIVNFNGGVFQPSATLTLSGLSAANVQAGGAVFDVPTGVTYTVTQPLLHDPGLGAGADGGVVKSGPGTLVLAGTNTYTGPTVVSNGTLSVTGAAAEATPLVAAPGGLLALTVPALNGLTVQKLSLGEATGAEAGLSVSADQAGFATGAVAVAGDLFLGQTAVTILMRETGGAPSANGTYVVLTCAGTISGEAANLRLANGAFGKAYSFEAVAGELRLTVSTATENSVLWKQTTGGDWSEAANWVTAPGAGTAGMTVGFLDAATAPAVISVADEVTAGTLLFDNANAYTLSGAGSLTLSATNGAAALTAQSGAHTVSVAAALESDAGVMAETGAELSLTGEVTGQGKLTKSGAGGLRLSAANTYAGGTDVNAGSLEIEGAAALGSGQVVFNGGSLAGKGGSGVTVANDVSVFQPTTLAAYAPLTLTGDWTASGTTLYSKTASNELAVAGSMRPSAGSRSRMEIREGSVRFAAGSEALFTNDATRNSIDFSTPAGASVVRQLTVEAGSQVTAGCLYVGYGASNTVSVTGGSLMLQGAGWANDAMLLGNNNSSVNQLEVLGGSVLAADQTWSLIGVDSRRTELRVSGGTVSLDKVSFGVRDTANNAGAIPLDTWVTVDGGLLEARQRWNWMAEMDGMRVNTVTLNGGRLRLPATFSSVTNRFNQSRLVFNGGVLETAGGGTDPEDPADYLKGLKQACVGSGGAVVDTQGRDVGLSQLLVSQGAADGGLAKRGLGTLTLVKPCVTGVVDVQAGTLKFKPAAGVAYPDDPMVRLSFENGILRDDSAYGKGVGLVGSIDSLTTVGGVRGTNALRFSGVNALYVNYTDDLKNADRYTVSAWVRQSEYQTVNQRKSFFGNMSGYSNSQYDFLLRIEAGHFRLLPTGQDNVGYGGLIADVVDALPLDTWKMLTLVVDGLNGFSMYVDGEKRTMRVNNGGVITYTDTYGAGKLWLLQPTARTSGKAFNIGSVAATDTDCFVGDLDDVTVYRRALNDAEIGLLYQAKSPFASRVRVAAGSALHLSGATQEVAEVTGEGRVGNGTARVTDALSPGDSAQSAAGALLTVTDSLTLGTNVTYACDWTPEVNDLVDVWGTLTVLGSGTIDLGLTEPSQMPGSPRHRSFPVMYYSGIVGSDNLSQWRVSGTGRFATASVTAAGGVVTVTLDVPSGTLIQLR